MRQTIDKILQYILPHHALSRLAGLLAHSENSKLKNKLIKYFIKNHPVDLGEAIEPDPLAYASFNAFFTRRLRKECRPIVTAENAIASPVDGSISELGSINDGRLLQAKGFDYSLIQLFGGYHQLCEPFQKAQFMTLYLAPHNYHRVHIPVAGTLQKMLYIPGRIFSVSNATTQSIPNIFTRNERVVCLFKTEMGPMAVIFVGAMLAASMSTAWEGLITPSKSKDIRQWHYQKQKLHFERGQEIGYFELGSTVIVLFANKQIHWQSGLTQNSTIRMGEIIGSLNAH